MIPRIPQKNGKLGDLMGETENNFYKRQYYKLLEFLPIPIAVSELVSQESHFLLFHTHYVNQKFSEIMGWTLEEVPNNRIWHELAYPDPTYRREIENLIYQLISTLPQSEQTIRFTSQIRCQNGDQRSFETFIEIADSLRPNFYTVAYIDLMPLNTRLEELENLSQKDPLTNLLNRRGILERLEQEQLRLKHTRRPFVVVLADLDRFKQLNDVFGHDCGDYVLKKIAQVFTDNLRGGDYVARWGGEEFLILLTETTLNESQISLERLRKNWSQQDWVWQGTGLTVTLTFGVAMHDSSRKLEQTIEKADTALYQGKLRGGNCVVFSD